jgi:transcriptional regulator
LLIRNDNRIGKKNPISIETSPRKFTKTPTTTKFSENRKNARPQRPRKEGSNTYGRNREGPGKDKEALSFAPFPTARVVDRDGTDTKHYPQTVKESAQKEGSNTYGRNREGPGKDKKALSFASTIPSKTRVVDRDGTDTKHYPQTVKESAQKEGSNTHDRNRESPGKDKEALSFASTIPSKTRVVDRDGTDTKHHPQTVKESAQKEGDNTHDRNRESIDKDKEALRP